MRFFEFNKTDYYGLICAANEEEAFKCYEEHIADLEEDDKDDVDEITKEEAINKIMNAAGSEEERNQNLKDIELTHKEAFVVLIDASLI